MAPPTSDGTNGGIGMGRHWGEDPWSYSGYGDYGRYERRRTYAVGDGLAMRRGGVELGDRITHLVMIDGLLVDVWSERVEDSEYADVAMALEDGRNSSVQPAPPEPPEPPAHDRMLAWLDDLVGGRDALLALQSQPPEPESPSGLSAAVMERRSVIRDLLGAVAEQLFDSQFEAALLRTLDVVCRNDRGLLTGTRSATQLAGGICWLVGKANGAFTAGATQTGVRDLLGLSGQLTAVGQAVQRCVGTPWVAHARPSHAFMPDYLATGCVDVLTESTRRSLIRSRDRALAEQAAQKKEAA